MADVKFSVNRAAESYMHLFWEMINRLNVVSSTLEIGGSVPPLLARELCYLQFRKICEMLALGSVFLHGDLPSAKSLNSEWNAGDIMRKLSRLHQDFFPRSATVVMNGFIGKNRSWQLVDNHNKNALTAPELRQLYSECGEILHRGKIKNLDLVMPLGEADFTKVVYWQEKLVALINGHVVHRANGLGFYFFDARDASGRPSCMVGVFQGDALHVHTISTKFGPA